MKTGEMTTDRGMYRVSRKQAQWLSLTLDAVSAAGYMIVEDVLSRDHIETIREHMYAVQPKIVAEVGQERLNRAGERGVLRLMMKYDPFFISLLEIPEVLAVVDATVSETAILQAQNGLALPPDSRPVMDVPPPDSFHRDFPRVMNGFMASINMFLTIDEFTPDNGATRIVPCSQQKSRPADEYIRQYNIPVTCPPGSLFIYDSTLLHAAGYNRTGQNRAAINQQFVRSYIKQQFDFVRALGDEVILGQKPRTQQLLGYYTRVVTSLDEYYQPEEKRLYRKGQW